MIKPLPKILPEDIPPHVVLDCQKCELSFHGTRVIWGEGNPSSPVFVILDNPGARENKFGEPFLCGTRETLQLAAYEAGIQPGQLYVSYILKCRPIRSYDKHKARMQCLGYLWEQIDMMQPKIVMTLGNVATQYYFRDPSAEVKNLRGKIHKDNLLSIVVSYHPLAVRRRPNLKKYFLEDWRLVALQL
ncbi:Uracil DNA glycosylase superfamily protein [Sporotomaculum syntrophicum]|uniref:Uracil DNA glycosylase superfamily protein n=1 Tax=Sporotomaculum syntrophicum TaxID=182264 RepID=A0A9D3AW61_9FIRM|nr:uracil-DNA glycosylase [Sporotomaculum syntrophicum]KAF1085015.1 Uracil DNA glycosylase superfamily protein [Sporotomaculum syntrophicum]